MTIATQQIKGSTGNIYTLALVGRVLICSCPGFGYRGHCRHASEWTEAAKLSLARPELTWEQALEMARRVA